jgi:DUF3006 family protein
MFGRSQVYSVDRLDGRLARLVRDDGTVADVPRRWLPMALREGTVVKVAVPASGVGPDWATASTDEAAGRWREALLGLMLEELRWRARGSRVGCVAPGLGF